MQGLILRVRHNLNHPFDVFANGLHDADKIVQRLFDNRTSFGNEQPLVTLMKSAKRICHHLKRSLADNIFAPILEFSSTVCGSSCSRFENLIVMAYLAQYISIFSIF